MASGNYEYQSDYAALSEAAKTALEELMANGNYEYQSEFAKKHQAEGKQIGRAEAVVMVLEARGLSLSSEQRARILACTDSEQIARWIAKALTVSSVDELF